MSYSSKKPYYNLDQSVLSFYRKPSRFLSEGIKKESVMEKPYLSLEYPQMHLDLEAPTWVEFPKTPLPEMPKLPEIKLPIIPAVPVYDVSGLRIKRNVTDCDTFTRDNKIECGESAEIRFETNLLGGHYMGEKFSWKFEIATEIEVDCLDLTVEPYWGSSFFDLEEEKRVTLLTEEVNCCNGEVLIRGKATYMGIAVITILTIMETYPNEPPTLFFQEIERLGYGTLESSCFQMIEVDCPCGWIEDWEGATITSNHAWTNLSPTGVGCLEGLPKATVYSFGGERIAKLETETSGGTCACYPYVNLRVSPEIPLNLEDYTGFSCKAYLAEFEPQTFIAGNCGGSAYWYVFGYIRLIFHWRLVDSGDTKYSSYGIQYGAKCDSGSYTTWPPGSESFTTFINKIGTWFSLPYLLGDSVVPWGNSNYELIYVSPYISISLSDAGSVHTNPNMKVYFSDIKILAV